MELKASTIIALLASCMVLVQSYALPVSSSDDETPLSADKRPKYMETRDLTYFKDLLLIAMDELIAEGTLSPNILAEPKSSPAEVDVATKRRSHLSICLQVSPSGALMPKPCWKNHGR